MSIIGGGQTKQKGEQTHLRPCYVKASTEKISCSTLKLDWIEISLEMFSNDRKQLCIALRSFGIACTLPRLLISHRNGGTVTGPNINKGDKKATCFGKEGRKEARALLPPDYPGRHSQQAHPLFFPLKQRIAWHAAPAQP